MGKSAENTEEGGVDDMPYGFADIRRDVRQAGETSQLETQGVQHWEVPSPTPGKKLCGNCHGVLLDQADHEPEMHPHGLANSILGCLRKSTVGRRTDMVLPLCYTLRRPHMEGWVQFWTSQYNVRCRLNWSESNKDY